MMFVNFDPMPDSHALIIKPKYTPECGTFIAAHLILLISTDMPDAFSTHIKS